MSPFNISVFSSLILLVAISYHPSQCRKLQESNVNFPPEQNPDARVFEGDIIISDEDEVSSMMEGVAGAGILGRHYRWLNQLIPYTIAPGYTLSQRGIILEAMKEISDKTCLRFQERDGETNYIYIQNAGLGDCSSYVGLQNTGQQTLNVSTRGCVTKGIVIHELVHAIGFFHEQSRTDRDDYVRILDKNINEDSLSNFNKYTSTRINEFDVPYDYSSIMHYGDNYFKKSDNLKTIVPLKEGVLIGQRTGLSDMDVLKITRMNCPEREPGSTRPRITSENDKLMSQGGQECVSECRKSGEAQDWCYINKESQGARHGAFSDYCTPHEDQLFILESRAVDGVVSAHGVPCGSKCEKGDNSISYRCTTLNPWNSTRTLDVCSPTPGYDHRMRKCATKCEFTANRFKWCYIEGGGFGYCSKSKPDVNLPVAEAGTVTGRVVTAHGSYCLTKCEKTEGRHGNTCITKSIVYKGNDWDYCSAQRGYDAYDRKCTSKCGLHGNDISVGKWCRVSENKIGYCSH